MPRTRRARSRVKIICVQSKATAASYVERSSTTGVQELEVRRADLLRVCVAPVEPLARFPVALPQRESPPSLADGASIRDGVSSSRAWGQNMECPDVRLQPSERQNAAC